MVYTQQTNKRKQYHIQHSSVKKRVFSFFLNKYTRECVVLVLLQCIRRPILISSKHSKWKNSNECHIYLFKVHIYLFKVVFFFTDCGAQGADMYIHMCKRSFLPRISEAILKKINRVKRKKKKRKLGSNILSALV